MNDHARAFTFLIWRTTRNRIARQVGRLRNPRYALALIMGGGYMWFVFLRPGASRAPGAGGPDIGGTLGSAAGIGIAITTLWWWLWGGVSGGLAFQPAEVQFLFTAPVSRRALIAYKIVRAQLLLLFNALIWSLLLRRWGVTISAPLRFGTAWGFFSILSLHRLGAALVQAKPVLGRRKLALLTGQALAALAAACLLAGILPVLLQFGTLGIEEGFRALGRALSSPPASYALAPFHLIMAPLYATSVEAWLQAFAIVFGVALLHLAWIFSMDVEFEENAVTATVALAKTVAAFKSRRAGGGEIVRVTKVKPTRYRLRPIGHPAVAIVWKNTVGLGRTNSARTFILLLAIIVVGSRLMSRIGGETGGAALAAPFLIIALMTFVVGPRMVRNDLRQDLLSLALLKSYPIGGAAVVVAEVTSPTVLLAAFQLFMLVVGYFSVSASVRAGWPLTTTVAIAVVTPFLLLALNATTVVIQNGMALLFPGWVRLGPDSGGIEAIGQNMLMMIGSLLALAIMLILPGLVGTALAFLLRPSLGIAAGAVAGAAVVIVLALQAAGLIKVLGGVFERMDPSALA